MIFPADSSQHSAVIDALSQKNFSLKGPPGTGKSQTIANIIGSFLSSNRSVLFLAEKKTAIEVVKKRLNQIGLGHFCLGVTSPKKIEVIDQLKLRLDKTSKLRINDFDDTRDKLLDNLSKLKQYKSIITKEFGNLGMQVYDILFNFLKVSDRITDNEKIILREIELNNIKNNSLNDIEDSKNKLLTLKKLGEEFKNYFKDKENHFKKIQKQLNPIEVDQLKGIISTVPQDIDNLIKLSIYKEFEITHNLTFSSFDKLFSFIEKFKNNKFYPKLLINEIQNNSEYVNEINEIQLNIETIIKSFTDFRLDQIINYYKSITKINDKFETLKDFKKNAKLEIDVIEKLCKKYSNIESDFKNIFSISKNSKDILEIINELFKNKDIILNISRNNCFKDKHLEKENYEILERARNQINELNDIYKTFETEFNLKKASVKFIQKNIQNLKEASSLTWFSSKYKEAKSYYLEICENNLSKIDKDIMISEFAKLLKYKKLEDEFTSNQDFINISLNNIDLFIDKLDVFSEVISFNKTVNDIIKDKKGSLSDNSLNSLLSIKSLNKFFEFYKELAIEEINKLTGSLKNDLLNLDKLFDDNQKQKSEIDKTIIDIDSLFLDENFKVEDIDSLYSQIKSIDKRIENIFKKYSIDIVSILKNFDEEMFSSTSSLINLLAEENYSKQIINYIISLSDKDPKLVEENIKNIKSNIDNLDNKIFKINELIEYDLKNNNLKDILAFCNNFEKDFSMLPKWFEYKKVLENDLSNDQRQFVNFLEEKLNLNNIELYYEFCFFYNLASKLYSENPILNEFGGESLETVRAQYKFLDDQIFDLHSKDIHNTINSRPVPEGISVGRKKDLTEFGLLDYLANTERPRVQGLSLRNLVYKTFNALQTLMPCFMMSPTYASQCLPRETGLFDLLIVDEASQLTPEMCLSSMARARQSIIVGDEKQLPPTNYFQQSEGDSIEEDEDIEVIEEKSILDQSLARFKNIRDLRWHYRSRHQNLISFSNENFYLSRLHIFPNSEPGNDYYGIKYHYVDTIYETKINQAEIQKICDLVEDFARNYPKKSSIVVTMNQYQEQEIENEISRRKAKSKELTDYIDYWDLPENKIEKFDVKNLENVQGDERDCVFISTIFGPQIKGKKPRQNFGPINKNTGHRRLNVLFTRAKDRIELITSLKSSDILTESKPLGCKIFADYLLYAETGKLKVRETYGEKDFDSPFQDYVRKEILSMGYEVVNEVGVRGFSIDIGIKDPKNSNKFLCGIECDGATYHSAKSVRDNDKLRQEILEGLGWNIYRIWSTDWFSDKENQVNKLKLYLENLCN